jgi:hypothetical protein
MDRVVLSLARTVLCVVATLCCASNALAHKPSDAYLFIAVHPTQVTVRWDIALRDLDAAFDLDADGNRELTWGEVRTRFADIDRYALEHLKLDDGRCVPTIREHALDHHSDGAYLVLQLDATCQVGDRLAIGYKLFESFDPTHRGVARITFDDQAPRLVVIDPASDGVVVTKGGNEATDSAAANPFAGGFVAAGIHHILIGYDHILFLICLLLPAVSTRASHHRQPVDRWVDAVKPVLVTVTAFTIAHTLTLALAGLRIVELSPRVIEPAIAATIIFTAIGNVWTTRFRDSAAMPFCFGLVHGFGFADVLHELDLPLRDFVWALLRFNVGVELGQLVIVAFTLTPLFLLRRWKSYRYGLLIPLSTFAVGISAIWFAERVLDFKLLPV